MKVKLSYIASEMDFASEEWSSYLNKETGEIVHLSPEDTSHVEMESEVYELSGKERAYRVLGKQVAALLAGERDFLANMANVAAITQFAVA